MSALRELLAVFQVDGTQANASLTSLTERIGGAKAALVAFGEALAGGLVLRAAGEFIAGQIEVGSALNDTSERLGVSSEELQKFQFAARLSGIAGEEAAFSLGFLNKNLGLAATGAGGAGGAFEALHIAVRGPDGAVRGLSDVALDLADRMQAMSSPAERAAAAVQVLGRAGARMVPILSQGRAGLAGLFDEFDALGGGMSKDFVASADAAGDEIDRLKFVSQGLKSQIALAVIPTVTRVVSVFKGWIATARDLEKRTNIVSTALIFLSGTAIFGVVRALGTLAKAFGLASSGGISGFLAGGWKLALWAGVIVAALAAVVLIVDELYTLFTGGDTLIQDFVDGLFGVGTAQAGVQLVKDSIADLLDFVSLMVPILQAVGATIADVFGGKWPEALTIVKVLLLGIVGTVGYLIEIFDDLVSMISYTVGAVIELGARLASLAGMKDTAKSWASAASNFDQHVEFQSNRLTQATGLNTRGAVAGPGANGGGALADIAAGLRAPGTPGASAFGPPTSMAGPVTNTIEQRNSITVQVTAPGGDASSIGSAMSGKLEDVMEDQRRRALDAVRRDQNAGL